MKKIWLLLKLFEYKRRKILYAMKLSVIFVVFFSLSVSARVSAQQEKISLNLSKATMQALFQEIQKQTDLYFVYNEEQCRDFGQVTIQARHETVVEVLDRIFKDTKFTYHFENDIIVVKPLNKFIPQEQTKKITGKVTDKGGNPLPGVAVLIEGTNTGVATDIDGKYSLLCSGQKDLTLIFSFIGMEKKKEVVNGRENIDVVMNEKVSEMDEVVVVGYGSVKKRDLTGSVSRVDERLFSESAATDIGTIMQGQVAGMHILTGSGAPGSDVQIQLRGIPSLTGNTSPLLVLNGVPMPENFSINSINPSDIKSIDVLKGASSAAIYGSRAAAGVIIITTKQGGAQQKASISYKFDYGFRQLASGINVLGAEDFKFLLLEAARNTAMEKETPIEDFKAYKTYTTPGFFGEEDTPWMKLLMQPATSMTHNINISGGTQGTNYFASFGYTDEKGMLLRTGYKRYNLSLNLDTDINSWIKAGLSLFGSFSDREDGSDNFDIATEARPDVKVYREDGSYYMHEYEYFGETKYYSNPLLELKEKEATTKDNNYSAAANLEFRILPELKLRTMYSYNNMLSKMRDFRSGKTYTGSGMFGAYGQQKGGLYESEFGMKQTEFEARLNYIKNFTAHSIDAVVALTYTDKEMHRFGITVHDFPDDYIQTALYQGTNFQRMDGDDRGAILLSYLARVNYKFRNRYLVTASVRRDGSSRFAPKYRYGTFPSAALAWIPTEEKFLNNISWLPYLKLRFGVGKTGMEQVDEYGWRTLFTGVNAAYTELPGIKPSQIGNDELRWESTLQYDLALDFSLLKEARLSGTLGFYLKRTDDLLYPLTMPLSTGMTSAQVNFASVENKGIEFDITAKIFNKGDFLWDFSFNIAKNLNKVTGLDSRYVSALGSAYIGDTVLEEGKSFGLFYGFQTDGLFQSWEEVERYEALNPDKAYQETESSRRTTPGDIKLVDQNNDGYVNRGYNKTEDKVILGCSLPDFTGGFSTRMSYKGFSLSIHGTYSYGNKKYWTAEANQFEFNEIKPTNLLDIALQRWTPEHPDAKYPKLRLQSGSPYFCDFYIHDASYLKIQNISLNYRFPEKWVGKIRFLSGAELFGSVNNVYTFTKYPGPNPESFSSNRIQGAAKDFSAYPKTRTFNVGVKVQL